MFCCKKHGCSSDDLEQFVLAHTLHLVCVGLYQTMAKVRQNRATFGI